jgi:hypothetical protein
MSVGARWYRSILAGSLLLGCTPPTGELPPACGSKVPEDAVMVEGSLEGLWASFYPEGELFYGIYAWLSIDDGERYYLELFPGRGIPFQAMHYCLMDDQAADGGDTFSTATGELSEESVALTALAGTLTVDDVDPDWRELDEGEPCAQLHLVGAVFELEGADELVHVAEAEGGVECYPGNHEPDLD